MIYFLRQSKDGPIGITDRDPPEGFEVLLAVEDDLAEARSRFAHLRTKGAWHAADPTLLSFIAERAAEADAAELLARRDREARLEKDLQGLGENRTERIQLMVRPSYRKWLDRFVIREGVSGQGKILERALAEYARVRKFREPPRR